jgi:hypothetical protein
MAAGEGDCGCVWPGQDSQAASTQPVVLSCRARLGRSLALRCECEVASAPGLAGGFPFPGFLPDPRVVGRGR